MFRFAERPATTVETVRGGHKAWVALDRPAGQPGLESSTEADIAAAFVGAKGWLSFGDVAADRALLLERAP